MAQCSRVSKLMTNHISLGRGKLKVVTNVPPTGHVYLHSSGCVVGRGESITNQTNSTSLLTCEEVTSIHHLAKICMQCKTNCKLGSQQLQVIELKSHSELDVAKNEPVVQDSILCNACAICKIIHTEKMNTANTLYCYM